jgi:hypothetical protein
LFIPDPDPDFLPIPDPGVKKAPDPGSITLFNNVFLKRKTLGAPGKAAGSARRHHRTLGEAEMLRLDVAEVDRGLEHDLQPGLWIRIHMDPH